MSVLQDVLQKMFEDGLMHGQIPQKRRLKRGLHLSMTCHTQGVTLIISRDDKYPSGQEWKTVIQNFPYYVPASDPVQIIDSDKRFALRAELPKRQTVAEQMKFT